MKSQKKKDEGLYLRKCANFYEFRSETIKKNGSLLQILRKSSCLRILELQPVFWESQASNCTPVATSLLLSLGHNPRLGGHNSRLGGTSSDLGELGPGMPPPWRRACRWIVKKLPMGTNQLWPPVWLWNVHIAQSFKWCWNSLSVRGRPVMRYSIGGPPQVWNWAISAARAFYRDLQRFRNITKFAMMEFFDEVHSHILQLIKTALVSNWYFDFLLNGYVFFGLQATSTKAIGRATRTVTT